MTTTTTTLLRGGEGGGTSPPSGGEARDDDDDDDASLGRSHVPSTTATSFMSRTTARRIAWRFPMTSSPSSSSSPSKFMRPDVDDDDVRGTNDDDDNDDDNDDDAHPSRISRPRTIPDGGVWPRCRRRHWPRIHRSSKGRGMVERGMVEAPAYPRAAGGARRPHPTLVQQEAHDVRMSVLLRHEVERRAAALGMERQAAALGIMVN